MIILVTGGASGLGETITRALAAEATSKVYFTYNESKEQADIIMAECPNALAIKCNFREMNDVSSLVDQMPDIDVLINNAYCGTFIDTYFHKTNNHSFLAAFKDNIIPTIEITRQAINIFRKKKSGKIITILTSAIINVPPTGAAVYTANKAYLSQMSKVWATENIKYNITSNTVSPSFMLTNFTNRTDERIVEQMKDNHPLKKLLTTQEVADAVFFLAKSSNQINGIDLIINAGLNIK